MIDYNQALKRMPGVLGLIGRGLELPLPQFYFATTFADFIQNREEIKPTRKVLPPACLVNGASFISIKSSVVYSPKNDRYGTLADLTHSADVRVDSLPPILRDRLEDGKRLHSPLIAYIPRGESILLLAYQDGPPKSQRAPREEKVSGNLRVSPA